MLRRDFIPIAAAPLMAQARSRNLVLVTCDGLRWQEVFQGIDPRLMNEKAAHMHESRHLRDRYWRESPRERREALMPFLWKTIAPEALVLDNVRVTNAYRVSYPGYSEILTGRAQDDVIRGNEPKQQPTETVLEFLKRKLGLGRDQVAVFGSWAAFQWISESKPGSVFINAGYADSNATPRIAELSRLQRDILTDADDARNDWFTFEMALDYLRSVKPRILYIAFNETDEWAHSRHYNRVLEMAAYIDRSLKTLWETLQSMPEYKGSTALVVTADHGRGGMLEDWGDHGSRVKGADRIWLMATGPDRLPMPAEPTQRDIAGAIIRMMGMDPKEYMK